MALRDWSPSYLRGLWLRWLAVYGVLALGLWAWPYLRESPAERAGRRALAAAQAPGATRADSVRAGLWPPRAPRWPVVTRDSLATLLAPHGIRVERRGDSTHLVLPPAEQAMLEQFTDGMRTVALVVGGVMLLLTAPLWLLLGMTLAWWWQRRSPGPDTAAG